MAKDILRKIITGGTLCTTDVTSEKKKELYALMKKYGMSESTSYLRFFVKGFKKWEIQGISELRDEFINTFLSNKNDVNKCSVGYNCVLSIDPFYNENKFYHLISTLKMGKELCDFMSDKGMASQMTVRTRFKANNWKSWEIKGIKNILGEIFVCTEAPKYQTDSIHNKTNSKADKKDDRLTFIEKNLISISQTLKDLTPCKTKNGIVVNVPMQDYMQLLMLKMRTGRTLKDLAIQAIHEYVERNII